MRKKYALILSYALSAGVLYALAARCGFSGIGNAFSAARPAPIIIAVAVSLVFRILLSPLLWQAALRSMGHNGRYRDLLMINAVSLPLKFVSPFRLSEVVRAAGLAALTREGFAAALGSTVAVKVAVIEATGLLLLAGALLKNYFAAAFIIAAALIIFPAIVIAIGRNAAVAGAAPWLRNLAQVACPFDAPGALALLPAAVILQAGEIACAFLLINSLGAVLGAADILYFGSLMILVSAVPVSVQGLGVRESAAVMWLGAFALSPETALSFGLLQSVVYHVLPAVFGSVLWLFDVSMRTLAKSVGKEIMGYAP